MSPIVKFKEMLGQTIEATSYVVMHPNVQKLLKSNIKFDLVISELALNEALLGSASQKLFVAFYSISL